MAPSTTQYPSRPVFDPLKCLAVFFFAALFFLCGADQYFATRLGGFNFRWGQILLLAAALFSLKRNWSLFRGRSKDGILGGKVLKYWGIFLAVYAFTALISDNPKLTLIKWVWGLFNIGCAALIFLDKRWGNSPNKGFLVGSTALALLVWAQAIGVYWLGAVAPSMDWRFTYPLLIHNLPFPLGYVQPGPLFDKFPILRMDAFYYEPSYAGCALAFAFPLVLITERSLGPKRFPFSSALVLSSILLVGSRSGILSATVGALVLLAYVWRNALSEVKPFLWKTIGAAVLAVVLFGLSTDARKYMAFTFGLFQDRISYGQLTDVHTSEGGRMASMLRAIHLWEQHPWLGNGLPVSSSGDQKVTVTTEDMWLEVGMESGLLGLLAFLGAIGGTMRAAWGSGPPSPVKGLILASWVSHFVVDMNFCQTFPRLDFWLFFFFSIRLLTEAALPRAPEENEKT